MRLIEFSNDSVKAVHKLLGATGLSALEAAGLDEQEKDAVLEAYGAFRGEVEEIQLDEFYAKEREQAKHPLSAKAKGILERMIYEAGEQADA